MICISFCLLSFAPQVSVTKININTKAGGIKTIKRLVSRTRKLTLLSPPINQNLKMTAVYILTPVYKNTNSGIYKPFYLTIENAQHKAIWDSFIKNMSFELQLQTLGRFKLLTLTPAPNSVPKIWTYINYLMLIFMHFIQMLTSSTASRKIPEDLPTRIVWRKEIDSLLLHHPPAFSKKLRLIQKVSIFDSKAKYFASGTTHKYCASTCKISPPCLQNCVLFFSFRVYSFCSEQGPRQASTDKVVLFKKKKNFFSLLAYTISYTLGFEIAAALDLMIY